jgi:ribosome-binding factor A
VRIDADLSQAIIFASVSPQTPQEDRRHRLDSLSVLIRAAGFIRSQLGKRLHLRRIPELHFKLDDSQERGDRILNLLDQISQEPQHDE